MQHTFYYHLIDLTDIEVQLDKHQLKGEEKQELMMMVKETIHYQVVTEILTHLPEEHHEWFLAKYTKLPHEEGFLEKLKEKIEDIEDKIKAIVEKVKAEILLELQEEE